MPRINTKEIKGAVKSAKAGWVAEGAKRSAKRTAGKTAKAARVNPNSPRAKKSLQQTELLQARFKKKTAKASKALGSITNPKAGRVGVKSRVVAPKVAAGTGTAGVGSGAGLAVAKKRKNKRINNKY